MKRIVLTIAILLCLVPYADAKTKVPNATGSQVIESDDLGVPALIVNNDASISGVLSVGNYTIWSNNYTSRSFTFDYATVTAQGKPTRITRGVHEGFSLPIYNNDNEELFTCDCIPLTWDESSDATFQIGGWLTTANTNKNFKLQVSVSNVSNGDIVSDTEFDIEVETDTGTASQYQFFNIPFPYDADGAGLKRGDAIGIRVRRIAANTDEITGEFVVKGLGVVWRAGQAGEPSM